MATLTSVEGGGGLTRLRIDKNKYGPSGAEAYLKLDRRHQEFEWVEEPDDEAQDAAEAKAASNRLRYIEIGDAILSELRGEEFLTQNTLYSRVVATLGGCSKPSFEAAVAVVRDRLQIEAGPNRSYHYRLVQNR